MKKIPNRHTLPSVILGISELGNSGVKVLLIHGHKASLGEITEKKFVLYAAGWDCMDTCMRKDNEKNPSN